MIRIPAGTGLAVVLAIAALVVVLPPPGGAQEPSPYETPLLFDGRLRAPDGAPQVARPADHSADFARNHAAAVATPGADCASCHSEAQCTDCHAGLVAPVSVHPRAWLSAHAFEALADPTDCVACHAPGRFCAGCHVVADAVALPTARPTAGFAAHPDGWLDPTSPRSHGPEARVDLLGCVSCHTGDECAACHIAVNPHGDDFRNRCRPMLDAAPETCAGCHNGRSTLPLDALRSLPGCAR